MKFIRKHLSNILFFGFIIFMFTPYGLPVRATLIKAVSFVTTRVFSMEIDKEDQVYLNDFNWQLQDRKGQEVNLKTFKGQVIVVNLWATWCPPCVAEMPSFQKLYNDYGDKVIFLFIANDDPDKVDRFLAKNGYELPVFFQTSSAPEAMSSNALPTTYIINSKGSIVASKIGAADWNSNRVRSLLDDQLP
ncbi:TlpA family protein disulfide reductase [Lutimonas sp.]|uniref:TlpA family protein disulfide reductase n=1 Tax=Lutimonas sp. TaxID=1872403 RepID=UPI003C728765